MGLKSMGNRGAVYSTVVSLIAAAGFIALLSQSVICAAPRQTRQKPSVSAKKPVPLKPGSKADPDQLIKVATMHVNDGAAAKVHSTFKEAKIPVMVMGQRLYGVLVKRKDRDRAVRLLKASSKKLHYWVQFD